MGFSLIELMVVIAIVATLAAIALPAYKNYIISARMSTLTAFWDRYVNAQIEYMQNNGHFPTSTLTDDWPPPGAISYDPPPGDSCGAATYQNAYFDPAYFGFDNSVSSVGMTCNLFNISGVISKQCGYWVVKSGQFDPTNYISGWINQGQDGTGAAWFAQYNDLMSQASCS